jgi:hypothetical protein
MLRLVRGTSALSHGVRFLLVLLISVAGALVAASATAQTPDSTATPGIRPPVTPGQTPGTQTPGTQIPPTQMPPTQIPPRQTPATATSAKRKPTKPKSTAPQGKAYKLHLHGGLFAPIDVNATSPTLGLRLGRRIVSHVQGGLLVGWTFERKNLEERVNSLPGLQPRRILARIDGQLVPMMAFLQVDMNETRFIVPYFGIASGYEWFSLNANDYRNDAKASATYSNFAWEGWGGMGMRLGPDMTFDTELFYNGGSLERDVTDSSGQSYKEAIHANGVGGRVGINFLF